MSKKISQNKRIGIAVIAVFLISFSIMTVFLDSKSLKNNEYFAKTSILSSDKVKKDTPKMEYLWIYEEVFKSGAAHFSPIPSIILNIDGEIKMHNNAFTQIISKSLDAKIDGVSIYKNINKNDRKDLKSWLKLIKNSKDDPEKLENYGPIRMSNGVQEKYYMVDLTPLLDKNGNIISLINFKDITSKISSSVTILNGNDKNVFEDYPELRSIANPELTRLKAMKGEK